MKHVDKPWEAYQIYDTCENKMNIFIGNVWVKDNFEKTFLNRLLKKNEILSL